MTLLTRIQGTLTVLRLLPGQRRVPFLPAEQIAELRDERVRETVRYAAETVPHYRDLFRREGIDPREIRTAADLALLPTTEKAALYDHPERFRSESEQGRNALAFHTSGFTTGNQMKIFHDRKSLLANIAFSERERAVEAAFCGRRVRYSGAELRYDPSAVPHVQAFYKATSFRPLRPRHHSIPIDSSIERVVETLNSLLPDSVRSYGSYLETLFRIVASRGLTLHRPKVLVYSADGMSPEGRAFIERDFGVPVLSRYNAIEAFKIGYFCEARDGFHLHEDLCHLLVVGPAGRPVPPGMSGEVVISNLVNRGTVILNYRLGDVGRMTAEPCSCGRTFKRLSELDGRITDVIRLPDGDVVHQFAFWGALKMVDGVIRYQLVQREPARFDLRLMTTDLAAYNRVACELAARASAMLKGAYVNVEHRDLLELEDNAKFRPIVPLESS